MRVCRIRPTSPSARSATTISSSIDGGTGGSTQGSLVSGQRSTATSRTTPQDSQEPIGPDQGDGKSRVGQESTTRTVSCPSQGAPVAVSAPVLSASQQWSATSDAPDTSPASHGAVTPHDGSS